jgi:DNA excision repair protein ERCC-2
MESNMSEKENMNGVDWSSVIDLFGYDNPRENQVKGMKSALETVGDEGYYVLEGACGTGKTMLSLSPLLALVRSHKTDFERIVVVTSVKQQQRAFEDDIEQINSTLPDDQEPVSGVTLVGKSDVNPYSRHDVLDENIYELDERLRENTRAAIDSSENPKSKAEELVTIAENLNSTKEWPEDAPDYPYPPITPVTEGGREYSPFYARYVADSFEDGEPSTIPFGVLNSGFLRAEDLVERSGSVGTDPHAVMGDLMEEVELVVANYYHIFEPRTVQQFTGEIIDESTLVIADEAHNLVPSVRDLLCDELSAVSLPRSQSEIEDVVSLAETDISQVKEAEGADFDLEWTKQQYSDEVIEQSKTVQELVDDPDFPATSVPEFIEMAQFVKDAISEIEGISVDGLNSYSTFLDDLLEVVDQKVSEKLDDEFGQYWQDANIEHSLEIPLRDPEKPLEDSISQWASLSSNKTAFRDSSKVGSFIDQCYEYLHLEIRDQSDYPTVYSNAVGRVLSNWVENDHTTFFRELTIEEKWDEKDSLETGNPWEALFNVHFELKNCIPSERLAERLGQFGGGVFMSATLEPMDVFTEVTGISSLEDSGRPVKEERYGLTFPERNRDSLAVNAPAFKYNAKEDMYAYGNANTTGDVRGEYSNALKSVVRTTPGNVLISMPSYSEAKWVAEFLSDDHEFRNTNIYLDESSTNEETEALKQKFFNGSDNVLVTGAHGTLVEGVDYKDERLDAVAVCGVPLENSHSPYKKAIKTAYNKTFRENGFEYAFTIPAVRKARQSLGRVIRSEADVGIRILIDERYTSEDRWDSTREWIPEGELREFSTAETEYLENQLDAFWEYQEKR